MAMVACRLFNRARQLCAPKALMRSMPIPKCSTYAYSAIQSKETVGVNSMLFNNFFEKEWFVKRLEAEKAGKEIGSPFYYPIMEDHVSTENAFLNSDDKKLEEHSRECNIIRYSTQIDSICEDKRLEEFQSSMTPNETQDCVMSKEIGGANMIVFKDFCEKSWFIRRREAAKGARNIGSPFCLPLLKDHVLTDSAFLDSDGKKLKERLRECKDIKFSTDFYSILRDKRLAEFRSTLTPKQIENYVMRHLYALALQKVLPTEKLYMTYLIEIFHNSELEDRWFFGDYLGILDSHSKLFSEFPSKCLLRTFLLHMSRIPYRRSGKKRLPKVFKKELLRKLEMDYKLLTLKIHDLPIVSQDIMAMEINNLVRCCGPNPCHSYIRPYRIPQQRS